jgi:CDP-diacylglycerol--glycerol-3-phosphate 3-phosphatidyltransferase
MSTSSVKPRERVRAVVFNFPNQLTILRLILAVILFAVIAWENYLVGMVLFIIAGTTDWLDGWYARRYGQVTTLGRILDPFADKVVVCGTFIFLVAVPAMLDTPLGLRPWMVVVIVGREILVTALRSFFEERGSDFSAKWSGKLKMVLQCIAAGAALYYLSYSDPVKMAPDWVRWTVISSTWLAVILTVYSGVVYVVAAIRLVRAD